MPTSVQHSSRRSAARRSTSGPGQQASTVSTRLYESLTPEFGCRSVRQSLEKVVRKLQSRKEQAISGKCSPPFSRARLPAGSTGSHCSRVSREATAMGSRSATSRASPLQYGPNHAVSCSTRHEAGHQDGHLQARTHAVGALKRLKRNLSSTRKTTANLSAASEGVTQPLISRREPKGLLPGQLMQTI